MIRHLAVTLLLSGLASAATPTPFTRFDALATQYRQLESAAQRQQLEPELVAAAQARRVALRALMKSDPAEAFSHFASPRGLPLAVEAQLEQTFEGSGRLEALCEYGRPVRRFIVMGDARAEVFVTNRLAHLMTKEHLFLAGMTLDGWAVLDEQRIPLNDPQRSPWTVGQKRLLMMRVDFSDDPGDPLTTAMAMSAMGDVDTFWRAASYGKTSATGTATPTLRMPQTKASYGSANATSQLLADARSASAAAGFNPSSYDFDMVAFRSVPGFSWAGLGFVGGKGAWFNGDFTLRVMGHELGHNLGLYHANFWVAPDDTIIGNGTSQEYGNPFDIMGDGSSYGYNAWYKDGELEWFNTGEVAVANASGTYRTYDLEQSTLGGTHAVQVPISGARDYWLEFRPGRLGLLGRSIIINWGFPTTQESQLLDMTPWTSDANDAPLPIGRTFSDFGSGIHITPTALAATNPGSIDVVVNRGDFSSDHAPTVTLMASAMQVNVGQSVTFTATAADVDNDPLAYFWDLSDGSASLNQSTMMKSFTFAHDALVRVTVTDMKGGTASAQVTVRVGTVSTVRASGRVADNGTGVEGVRVIAGTRFTFTDSDGQYILTGMNPGNATITAVKPGWTLSPTFSNPVTVGSTGSTGLDFSANRAGFGVFGRITSVGQGLPGITVSAGPYSAVTNSSGDYILANVPNGLYTLTARGTPGQSFLPVGWSNPVQVNGSAVTGRNFIENVVPVSGTVTGLAGPHTISDGVHTVVSTLSGGSWLFIIPRVAPGDYNVVATAPGQLITPSFSNPVTVGTTAVNGLTFVATAGTGYLVRGRIDEAGAGLTATTVTATAADGGLASSGITDGNGRYALINVPNGDFTVAPQKSGYTFLPMTRAVLVAGADVVGQDFGVFGANAPPIIVFPPTAQPYPVVGTTTNLFVLGDDPAPANETDLAYTWSRTLGPAPVTFNRNGTNGSKASTVTFTTAGAYGFDVEVKDPGNLTVHATLAVLVPQIPTSVAVTPPTGTLSVGDTRQYVGALTDQFGHTIDTGGDADWALTGTCGTLTAWGRFTATAAGTCTISATMQGKVGTATVTTVVGPVPRITSGPTVTPSPVLGDTAQATVTADDDMGESKLTYTWSAMNPPASVAFAPNGTNAAKTATVTFGAVGTYSLRVDVVDETGLTQSGFVQVVVQLGFSRLELAPASASVEVGKTLQLSAVGRDQLGAQVTAPACTWTATGGTVDATGLFTAPGATGAATVTATCGGKSASSAITVVPAGSGGGSGGGAGGGDGKGKGCGCTEVDAFAPLLGVLALATRRRRSLRRSMNLLRFSPIVGATVLLVLGCSGGKESASSQPGAPVASVEQALGEPLGGYPGEQERMLHVLINQARHSAKTPNGNECGDYTAEVGANVKKIPLVYRREANLGARFSARHMSEVGCYQNDNCCELGDAGAGLIGCLSAGSCSGQQCAQTCDAGAGQTPAMRYGLFGFSSLSGVSIARNLNDAYAMWCGVMQNTGVRGQIYADAGTELGTGFWQASAQMCTGAYWALAFGNSAVQVPRIPAASAMYSPPNPLNTSQLYFAANYYDPSGHGPQRSEVVVAGHCFDMDRAWGFDDNGTYETRFPDPDVIPDGCHPYYFLFFDADGGRVTYPTTGSLNVAIGDQVTCPLPYDPAPQAAADCETGALQCPTGARRPCYTADQATLAHGECRQGTQLCRTGFWGACRDMVGPFAEACDGLDNNCDGQIDEGDPGGGASCSVFGELGLCQAGERHCVSGRLTCVGTVQPQTELCDGLDNDCDGEPDDGFGLLACGQGDCARLVPSCFNGVPQVCDGGTPGVEVEDGHDNDCNGLIDEGIDCRFPDGGGINRSHDTYGAPGSPPRQPCATGVETCQSDGGWRVISRGRVPVPEACNGEDDDCDGFLDNSREVLVQLGYLRCGVGACTVKAIPSCSGGTPRVCTPTGGGAEICDGVDDNCDGVIDNACNCRIDDARYCYTGPSETRDSGVCHPGLRTCLTGTYTRCTGETKPSQEYCNGLDDDCDGVIDNNCLADAGTDGGGGGMGGGAGGGSGGGAAGGAGGGDGGTAGGSGGAGGGGSDGKKGCGCSGADGALWMGGLGLLGWVRRRRALSP